MRLSLLYLEVSILFVVFFSSIVESGRSIRCDHKPAPSCDIKGKTLPSNKPPTNAKSCGIVDKKLTPIINIPPTMKVAPTIKQAPAVKMAPTIKTVPTVKMAPTMKIDVSTKQEASTANKHSEASSTNGNVVKSTKTDEDSINSSLSNSKTKVASTGKINSLSELESKTYEKKYLESFKIDGNKTESSILGKSSSTDAKVTKIIDGNTNVVDKVVKSKTDSNKMKTLSDGKSDSTTKLVKQTSTEREIKKISDEDENEMDKTVKKVTNHSKIKKTADGEEEHKIKTITKIKTNSKMKKTDDGYEDDVTQTVERIRIDSKIKKTADGKYEVDKKITKSTTNSKIKTSKGKENEVSMAVSKKTTSSKMRKSSDGKTTMYSDSDAGAESSLSYTAKSTNPDDIEGCPSLLSQIACPPNEHVDLCNGYLYPQYCEDIHEPFNIYVYTTRENCLNECVCDKGYYRNSDGACVPADECENYECEPTEKLDSCGDKDEKCEMCGEVCGSYAHIKGAGASTTSPVKPLDEDESYNYKFFKACTPRCACKRNYCRNSDGICINVKGPGGCPQRNTQYSSCRNEFWREHCDFRHTILPEEDLCFRGCECKTGYLRNSKLECVPPEDCECPLFEKYDYDRPCEPRTCNDIFTDYKKCKAQLKQNCTNITYNKICQCHVDMFRNEAGDCIHYSDCPCPDPNSEMVLCPYKCGGGTCASPAMKDKCKNSCDDPPYNKYYGCQCKPGYVRKSLKNPVCIRKTNCPKT